MFFFFPSIRPHCLLYLSFELAGAFLRMQNSQNTIIIVIITINTIFVFFFYTPEQVLHTPFKISQGTKVYTK